MNRKFVQEDAPDGREYGLGGSQAMQLLHVQRQHCDNGIPCLPKNGRGIFKSLRSIKYTSSNMEIQMEFLLCLFMVVLGQDVFSATRMISGFELGD